MRWKRRRRRGSSGHGAASFARGAPGPEASSMQEEPHNSPHNSKGVIKENLTFFIFLFFKNEQIFFLISLYSPKIFYNCKSTFAFFFFCKCVDGGGPFIWLIKITRKDFFHFMMRYIGNGIARNYLKKMFQLRAASFNELITGLSGIMWFSSHFPEKILAATSCTWWW